MGEVWRARDERLDRYVAIKLLPSALAEDPERRARMLREAKAAAAVPHPNVVTLFDILSEDGQDFLVMELVEGKTLSERIRERGALPTREALDCLLGLTDALTAAHAKGILHRDIKAANVMVDSTGKVKVLDFGLAKLREAGAPGSGETSDSEALAVSARTRAREEPDPAKETLDVSQSKDAALDATMPSEPGRRAPVALDETMPSVGGGGASESDSIGLDETLASTGRGSGSGADMDSAGCLETRAGTLLGTPMYMAPEQLKGEAPDEQTEVYSVGVVAYELAAGRSPWAAANVDELFAKIESEAPRPLGDTLPSQLREVVERAMEKDRGQRHGTMAELRDALREVEHALFAPPKRARWPWALAAAIVAAVVAAVVVYATTRSAAPPPERPGDKYVRRALEEYNVFFNDKAKSSLRAAIKHDPDHPSAYAYMILFGYAGEGEMARALDEASRIAETLPEARKKERALLGAAIAQATDGPPAARRALLEVGAESDAELAFWSAELAYRARDYDEADRGFRALLASEQVAFRGRIYDHFSAVLLYFDKAEEAVAVGKLYYDAFPGEADALGVHATTLAAAGQFDEALRFAKEAVELAEGEDTLAGLAKVHAWRGEFEAARRLYAKSMQRAGDGRRPMRRAALGILRLLGGDAEGARAVVAPCLAGGMDAAIRTRGACLWVAGLVDRERIPDILVNLDALATAGTAKDPAYGFPANLARLLRARAIFDGGGCLAPAGAGVAPTEEQTTEIKALLDDSRDFYASYHVPFFASWALCERAALARALGNSDAAAQLLETVTMTRHGRGLLLLDLARSQAAIAKPAALATLDRLFAEWPTLDATSRVWREAQALRATIEAK